MDSTASTAATPTANSVPKKRAKVRKLAKDITLDERKVE
jgi:hypothetical protein